VSADLSIVYLITGASPLVQLVMLALVLASLISWTFIFQKWNALKRAKSAANEFEDRFWSGGDLGKLYREISSAETATGMDSIFASGFAEFSRLRKQPGVEAKAIVEGAQRAMRIALARETDRLEHHLAFLATVGSTSPYVGLLGTVWGIMNSFRSLANIKQATLAQVAPGIAEALIATAMGLFAAIPAVVAYNRYSNDVERLLNRYDTFVEEFSTILQRQTHVT